MMCKKLFPLLMLASVAMAAERPNILWLTSEDNSYDSLGCYGNKLARTPNLDALAKKGVLFENCYSMPVCAPSRFTLITGMYPTTCGPAQHMRASGKIPAWLTGFPKYLKDAGYYTSNNSKTDYNSPLIQKSDSFWCANSAQASWKDRTQETMPFFSVFNHTVCHESCLFPAEKKFDFSPTDPAKVRVPPYQPDVPEVRQDIARAMDCITEMDRQCGEKLKQVEAAGLAENTIVFYYGDNGGITTRTKRFLQDSGTHVPLIVYFPPKWQHLAPAAPGSRIKDVVHFVDFAPTVLSLAGLEIPKYMQGRAFAGQAKAPAREYVHCTRDRMDERYDMMRSAVSDRYLYIRNFRPDLPYVQLLHYKFQARDYQAWARLAKENKLTPQTALFWGQKPSEELYDKQTDPDCMNNLAAKPECREVLEKMRKALCTWMVACNDNGLLPEGASYEGYEASRQAGAFSAEQALSIALKASDRKVENLPEFMRVLSEDKREYMRWWAAQGCAILGKAAAPAEAVLLKAAKEDASGAVQVAAADALRQTGHTAEAIETLRRCFVQQENSVYALHAANVIDRLGEAAGPLLPEIKERAEGATGKKQKKGGGENYSVRMASTLQDMLTGKKERLVYPKAE
jgi:arylsulfatase A-like enzyme